METTDIRKFLRIECKTPICTQISIVKFNNKLVTSGTGNICVVNISSGGLKFLYSLSLPVNDNILIEFRLKIAEMNTTFYGHIVRKEEINLGIYRYGVKFVNNVDNNGEQFISKLNDLNKEGILKNSELCLCYEVDCIRKYTGKFNNRINTRYKLNNFVAKMKMCEINNKPGISPWVNILLDNISQGGIQFITDDEVPLEEDTILEFKIVIADKKIYSKGYVVWGLKADENKFRYGVKLDITDLKREKIAGILDEVVDFSLERGLLTHEGFIHKFNYSKIENHCFERRV